MSAPSPLWWLVGAAFVVYLLAPLLLVVLFAFTNRAITNFPIEHLSLRWWREMLEHPQFLPSLRPQPDHRPDDRRWCRR